MQLNIRRAGLEDAENLSDISKVTFYDTFTGTCTEADMQSYLHQYYNLEQVKLELSNPADHYYLADVNGITVGYLRFMEDYSSFPYISQWKALELKRIYVRKEFHGKGIAQQLMQYYLDYACEQGYEVAWLGVWEHNMRAQKFYEKYGFVNSGQTHDFPIGNTPQTDYWFIKQLK